MPTQLPPTISEDAIANYLLDTPAFFERHAELLARVQLSSPHNRRAVSLQERQASLLREKIHLLERQIMDLMRHASDNMALSDKLLRWAGALFANVDAAALPQLLTKQLAEHFAVPQVAIKIWDVAAAYAECSFASGVSLDAQSFASALSEPFCGAAGELEVLSWLAEPTACASLALLPLRDPSQAHAPDSAATPVFGLLLLASPDAQRFSSSMSTDFLARIAQLASAALAKLRPNVA